MKVLVFFALLSSFVVSYAQTQSVILSKQQNDEWIKKLKQNSFGEQLGAIKDRLLSDNSIYVRPTGDIATVKAASENRTDGVCKLLLVVQNGAHIYPVNLSNRTEHKKIIELCELLNQENIKSIKVLDSESAIKFFASRGLYGEILIAARNETFLKEIINLKL